MASTSASSDQKRFKYDVFLSFRGEDTRKTFVDHLYHALNQKGLITYKDDEKIEKGEMIKEQLIRSIEESRFYIIVFSKKYASSSWCLEELVKIMECQKLTGHTAYPIFYDVEPTEVRNQSGSVGEAFERFTRKRKRTLEDEVLHFAEQEKELEVGRWRNALKEAAGLAGMELKNTFNGHEARFIQQIVQDVSLKLHFFNSGIDGKLVGMETRVKDVVSSLEIDSDDVRMIGIKGMGGGGKTTLARAVFDHISISFEGKSFVENVREGSKGSGLKELQKKVLQNVFNDKSIDVESVYDGRSLMKKMMCSRKVLVVLDDVDDIGQLEALAGEPTWFKQGSRFIITTRDEQVLKAHRVNFIHDVCLLSQKEAMCLFSRCAFGREIPNQGYADLSRKVVHYAAGLPLTIKVLGSFFCDRTKGEWEDAIERLKTIPLKETLEKLELSFNGLENDQKEIFLDIACILKGESKKNAIKILESCGFRAQIGLRVLEQKSLITIYKQYNDGMLLLHDHIEEMGRNIVRRLHPDEPKRHSRLWIKEEIEDILVNESGTEEIKCINLNYTHLHPTIIEKGLRKMKELRCLCVNRGGYSGIADEVSQYLPDILQSLSWCFYPFRSLPDEVSQYLPDTLQSLSWSYYPFRSLPESFQAHKLVNLEMTYSNIYKLWTGGEEKVLNKLKFLNLCGSEVRTFDLTMAPHLEVLNFGGCINFVELQFPVECTKLKFLNLSGTKVSNLNLGMTPHLEELDLGGCIELVELQLPNECLKLKFLNLSVTKVSNLNLGMTPHLEKLNLHACNEFELHMPVECPDLRYLELKGSKVSNLNLGLTPHLERLFLTECYCLQEIHVPVGCLTNLIHFSLDNCSSFVHFHVDKQHESTYLDSVATFNIDAQCVPICPLHPKNNLPVFSFTCKFEEPGSSWSGNLEKLISFSLCACKNLEYLSTTICGLQHLRELTVGGSIPGDLWQLESLEKLCLSMVDTQYLPDSICMLKHLKSLTLESCWDIE
ncbi:putative TIR domain, P-loop containing nucleoside triphosphate hydrolase [Helianthus annuus]|nr:putative TIR domain, P-loop containing nucleoside triphosphate hydrolase [Helianthus annuus]KAJ0540750.1 putative TIR domain, P-loop containing nucleoside triphosphate hydrolase [Helianthus annuus]KAJ0705857.1 putative TIR domain, P-loop containing nucleoside triphosphate hydrolase [Helianthus annuus]